MDLHNYSGAKIYSLVASKYRLNGRAEAESQNSARVNGLRRGLHHGMISINHSEYSLMAEGEAKHVEKALGVKSLPWARVSLPGLAPGATVKYVQVRLWLRDELRPHLTRWSPVIKASIFFSDAALQEIGEVSTCMILGRRDLRRAGVKDFYKFYAHVDGSEYRELEFQSNGGPSPYPIRSPLG